MPDGQKNKMNPARDAPPVADHPRLARMSDKAPRPRKIDGEVSLMADETKPDPGGENRMAPFERGAGRRRPRVLPDQEEAKAVAEQPVAKEPEGYVRLRVRVENGEMAVVGAKAVEGPLVEGKLHGELAYEVTLGTKRLAAGAVPDIGVKRSFPHPEGTPEQQGHYVTPLPSYEVNVRVPKDQVSMAALPRLEIALYRVKEEIPVELLQPGALGAQFTRELREVARLKGVRPEGLAAPVAEELRRALE